MPASIYGVPTTPAPRKQVEHLRTCITKLVDPRSAPSRSSAHALACLPKEMDPDVHILVARCVAVRQAWHGDAE
eukprot:15476881-Alexandrium_andersonii.AAC.1